MQRKSFLIAFSACLFSLSLWGALLAMNLPCIPEGQSDPNALKSFAQDTNQFGFDLFQKLREQPGNLFISPYNISSALAMTACGARGETAQQMTKVLHLPDDVNRYTGLEQGLMDSLLDNSKDYDIRIANALWGQNLHPFKQDIISLLQRSFRAEARSMNFLKEPDPSRRKINAWVEAQTNNRIKDLLPAGSINPDTRLVLTNAIYFKAEWITPFDKRWNKSIDFALNANDKVKADAMFRVDQMSYTENDSTQVLELPYKGNRLSMVVLLPKKHDGLRDVESGLSAHQLNGWISELKSTKVNLTFPKIKTTYSAMLGKTLSSMGMTDAFDTSKADFSSMDGTRELALSEVIHKAFCEINEAGTEAAAATATVMRAGAPPRKEPPPVEFRADHPYLHLIRDKQTGALLFLGRVADPRS